MAKVEVKVQYWEELDPDETDDFWVADAMKAAVGQLWFNNFRGTNNMPERVVLRLNRDTGIVTAYGEDNG